MSTESWVKEIGREIDAKNVDKIASYFCEDGVFIFGNGDPVIGKKAVIDYMGYFFTMIKDSTHHYIAAHETGNTITWQGTCIYTRMDDSKTEAFPNCNVLTMEGSLIKKYQIYVDNHTLFNA